MKVLVTGGAGFIGSHTLIALIEAGHEPVVIDNFINSSEESVRRVEAIVSKPIELHNFDVRDTSRLDQLFKTQNLEAVIHFAGLKSVSESVSQPLKYYETNIGSSLSLLNTMLKRNVKKLIFSSSATVYGIPENLPLNEGSRTGVGLTNPYGQTKYMIEQIIRDVVGANKDFEAVTLRYFNPIGAHESGTIGEDPKDIPNNLLPYVSQVAVGKLEQVGVFGDDYDTVDGTGVRDYIHVMDLARGHVAALTHNKPGLNIYNLGSGHGTSVLELIDAFSKACGKQIPYKIQPRRPGDVAACYADCSKALKELGWKAEKTILEACEDAWRWQSNNPDGYKTTGATL